MLSITQKGSNFIALQVEGDDDTQKYKISGDLTEDIEVSSGSQVIFSDLEADQDHNFTSSLAGVSRLNVINTQYLSLAEVQLLNDSGTNFAPDGITTQSTTGFGGISSRAIDGNTNQLWSGGSITHTNNPSYGWWQLDMPSPVNANKIVIYNRIDSNALADRLRGSVLRIYNQDDELIFEQTLTKASVQSYSF